jgi:ADP-ribose pyrophosphatase
MTGFSPIQVKAPDWVTMIARRGGNFVLVKQHRWGIDKDCIEFVTGQVDEGEHPLKAACRELREETGWMVNPNDVKHLGSVYTNPAFMTNQMHYYFVDLDLHGEKGGQSLDEHEKIEVIEGDLPMMNMPALMLAGVHLLERKTNERS